MGILWLITEALVVLFGAWTLAYHACLALKLPAGWIWLPFVILAGLMTALLARSWRRCLARWRMHWFQVLIVLAVAACLGSMTFYITRPNADDFSHYHRALYQLNRLDQPFATTHTAHEDKTLPTISVLHLMTSYEHLMAMTAERIGCDPIWFYQQIGALVPTFMLPIVLLLLFHRLRFGKWSALLATLAAIGFLLIDGSWPRSFGHWSIGRFWQGKVALCTVGLPITFLIAHRYLARRQRADLVLLFLAGVCAIGLSGSGVFLMPILILAMLLSAAVSFRWRGDKLRRAMLVNAGMIYPVAIGAMLVLGVLESPDMTQWSRSKPSCWSDNLALVFSLDAGLAVRSFFILLVVPMAALTGAMRKWFAWYLAWLFILFGNPVSGSILIKIIKPAAFWRLAYLAPLVLCAGMIPRCFNFRNLLRRSADAPAFDEGRSRRKAVRQIVIGLIAITLIVCTQEHTIFHVLRRKAPHERNMPRAMTQFVQSVEPALADRRLVLAPMPIVWVLSLEYPELAMYATRPAETAHVFRTEGREQEGRDRLYTQMFVGQERGKLNMDVLEAAIGRAVDNGVDAVFVRASLLERVRTRLPADQWPVRGEGAGFVLLTKAPGDTAPGRDNADGD